MKILKLIRTIYLLINLIYSQINCLDFNNCECELNSNKIGRIINGTEVNKDIFKFVASILERQLKIMELI